VKESPVPDNPFVAESTPVRLTVQLRELPGWAADWKPIVDPLPEDLTQAPKNPAELPSEAELQSPGEVSRMTLIPYGSAHLRLTTFPVIR
jgi:hypothetical protein